MSRPSKVKEGHPTDFPTISIDGKDSEAMQEVLEDGRAGVGFETGVARRDCGLQGEIANPIGKTGGLSLAHSKLLLRPTTLAGTEIRIRPCRQR